MSSTRVVVRAFGQVIATALALGLAGFGWGLVLGSVFGGGCATLGGLLHPAYGPFHHLTDYTLPGAMIGAEVGIVLGGCAGLLAGIIVGAIPRPDCPGGLRTPRMIRRLASSSSLCAAAGGLSGAALNVLLNVSSGQPVWLHVFDLGGGFFFGSIAGFTVGAFAGALYGGFTDQPVSLVDVAKRVTALPT